MPAENSTNIIPFGYCQCGCRNLTEISTQKKFGYVKGQPKRFLVGHNNFKISKSHVEYLREALRTETLDCLLWPFYLNNKGYGSVCFQGHKVFVHRLAFYLTYGHWPEPEGCHRCDTPACFNPRHIFEGTHKDNIQDATRKLRMGQKLTAEQIKAIRAEYAPIPGRSTRSLAKKYNVSRVNIKNVVNRAIWKFVGD